ncbi:MAG: response regulator transcription factor [Ktedonobacterales bacterium]
MTRILVVDDDRAIRELMKFALECEGYAVATLSDGGGALRMLANQTEPCIVLMDLMMPGVDGWAVCRQLAAEPELLGQHRLVVMTALRMVDADRPTPASAILYKPFDLDQLLRLVAALNAELLALEPVAECGGAPMALAS